MYQELDSSPTDRHQQSSIDTDPDGEFQEAASILDGVHGFGGALWNAEMNEALSAKQKIKSVPAPHKKAAFQSCMHNLRESMVAELERWAPEYVKVAAAYPQFAGLNPIEWTRTQMQKVINQRLRKPDRNGAIAFCLIKMSGRDDEHRHQWRAPNWMYGSPQACRSLRMDPTNFIIQEEHRGLAQRLNYALNQTLARMKISLFVAAGQDHKVPKKHNRVRQKSPRMKQAELDILAVLRKNPTASAKKVCDALTKLGKPNPYSESTWDEVRGSQKHENAVEVLISRCKLILSKQVISG